MACTKSVRVNIRNAHFAELLEDSEGTLTHSTPIPLTGIREVGVALDTTDDEFFAEGKKCIDASNLSGATLTVELSQFTNEERGILIPRIERTGAVNQLTNSKAIKQFAIGYEVIFDDGATKFFWWYKTNARLIDDSDSIAQSEDSRNFQPESIEFRALFTNFKLGSGNETLRQSVQDDDVDYAGEGDTWFDQVFTVPTAFTIVTNPLDAATGVSTAVTPTITTTNKFANSTITDNNIFLEEVGQNIVVPGTLSVDVALQVITFTPDSVLASATQFELVITGNLKDTFGQPITFTKSLFTTA